MGILKPRSKERSDNTSMIGRIARKTWNAGKAGTKTLGKAAMKVPMSVASGVASQLKPSELVKAAASGSPIASAIVEKLLEKETVNNNTEETERPVQEGKPRRPEGMGSEEVVKKLDSIDDNIVNLKYALENKSNRIARVVKESTAAQTIILARGGQFYNKATPLALPSPGSTENNDNRMFPSIQRIFDIQNDFSRLKETAIDNNFSTDASSNTIASNHSALEAVLDRKDDDEDDKVAEEQAEDIRAIRKMLEHPKPGSAFDRAEESQKEGGWMSRLRNFFGKGGAGAGLAGRGSSILSGAGRAIGGAGRGVIGALGGLGAGLTAASTAALVFGGTGLYSAYKAARGEDASNWISNLTDKGVQAVTGDKDASIGTKIYDWTHDEQGNNSIAKFFGINTAEDDTKAKPQAQSKVSALRRTLAATTTAALTASGAGAFAKPISNFIAGPETNSEVTRLETNKMISEKQQAQPIVVNAPQPAPQKQMSPGQGGGQSMAPLIVAPQDSTLRRASDRIIQGSL